MAFSGDGFPDTGAPGIALPCRSRAICGDMCTRNVLPRGIGAWNTIVPVLQSGAIKPIVAKTFPLAEAAHALRYLVEGRPFGRVVLTV